MVDGAEVDSQNQTLKQLLLIDSPSLKKRTGTQKTGNSAARPLSGKKKSCTLTRTLQLNNTNIV
jgi:hypothetical protein